jgi:4-amino-4-deoxy-L-arabinose transferase-like glycosyltransferase
MSRQRPDAIGSHPAAGLGSLTPAWWHLPALIALALVMRWVAWSNALMMFNDGPDFLWQAQMMLEGRWLESLHHQYHPLYAVTVAGLSWISDDLADAAAWASILSSCLLIAGVFGTARVLLPDRYAVALVAGLLAAIHTRTVRYGADVQSDALMMAMAALACWTGLLGWRRRRLAWMLASGVFVGLAYLTRPEALILVAPLGLWVLDGLRRKGELARRVGSGLAFSLGLTVALLPFVLAIHEFTGGWGLSMHSQLRAFGLAPAGVELGFHPESPMASPLLGPHPSLVPGPGLAWGAAIAAAIDNLMDGLRIDMLIFSSVGAVWLWRSRRRELLLISGVLLLLFFLGTVQSKHAGWFASGRYFSIPVVLLFPVAAAGWLWIWERAASPRAGRAVRALLVVALVLVVAKSVSPRRERHAARLEALEWIRDTGTSDEPIVVERRRDGWYAKRPVILAGLSGGERELLALARTHDGGYLLFELEDLEELAPHWLEAGGPVREVARFEREGAKTVVVLRRVEPPNHGFGSDRP